jgi:hypothetical protein
VPKDIDEVQDQQDQHKNGLMDFTKFYRSRFSFKSTIAKYKNEAENQFKQPIDIIDPDTGLSVFEEDPHMAQNNSKILKTMQCQSCTCRCGEKNEPADGLTFGQAGVSLGAVRKRVNDGSSHIKAEPTRWTDGTLMPGLMNFHHGSGSLSTGQGGPLSLSAGSSSFSVGPSSLSVGQHNSSHCQSTPTPDHSSLPYFSLNSTYFNKISSQPAKSELTLLLANPLTTNTTEPPPKNEPFVFTDHPTIPTQPKPPQKFKPAPYKLTKTNSPTPTPDSKPAPPNNKRRPNDNFNTWRERHRKLEDHIITLTNHIQANQIELAKLKTDASMLHDLKKVFADDDFKDFRFVIKEFEFPVHKLLFAARSPVFAKMVKSNREAVEMNLVDIPVATFQTIVDFVYDKSVPVSDECLLEVFAAAGRLNIADLMGSVAARLHGKIDERNAFEILALANKYGDERLRLRAFEFIQTRMFPERKLDVEFSRQPEKVKKLIEMKRKMDEEFERMRREFEEFELDENGEKVGVGGNKGECVESGEKGQNGGEKSQNSGGDGENSDESEKSFCVIEENAAGPTNDDDDNSK